MSLKAQGIDNNDSVIGRVRRACVLSDDDGGVGRRQGIRNASEGLETTTETEGGRRRDQGIYDGDRGVGGGRLARRLKQQQRMRRHRIDNESKGSKTATEAAAD